MALELAGPRRRPVRDPVGVTGRRRTRTPGTQRTEAAGVDPKYANIELVETVYGNDQSEESYNQAVALIDKYPDLKLIMTPDVGRHRGRRQGRPGRRCLCDQIKVTGLGVPPEMMNTRSTAARRSSPSGASSTSAT